MIRVVTVIPAKRGITGASLALIHALNGLVRKNVCITVVTSAGALRYPAFNKLRESKAVCHVLHIDHLPSPLYWLILMLKLLLVGRHDIAHFSTPKTFLSMYPAARIIAKRIILTLEGYAPHELSEAKPLAKTIGMLSWILSLKLADRITACSDWLREVVEKTYGHIRKLSTVYNAIDYERFAKNPVSQSGRYLLVVARLEKVKGIDTALKALSHMRNKHQLTPRLLVIGSGIESENLEKMARELEIEKYVEFLGFRHDVERFVKDAYVLLMPSRYEPFGMPAAEAGAAGVPVIASVVGGLKEIVVDGVTGLLFRRDDHVDLAEKTVKVLRDESLRRRMGEAARKWVSEKFSPEVIAKDMIRVYVDALSG